MNRRTVLRGGTVLLGGMIPGCADTSGSSKGGNIDVSVSELRLASAGETSLTLTLSLSVDNGSDAELTDPSVETTLSYNSSELTTVEKSVDPIPAGEQVTRSIEITLVYEEMTQIALKAIRGANALVDVEGTFRSKRGNVGFEETVSVTE